MLKIIRSTAALLIATAASAASYAEILEVKYIGTVTAVDAELLGEFSVGESVLLYTTFDTASGFDMFGGSTSWDATRFNPVINANLGMFDTGFIFGGDYSASGAGTYGEFWDLNTAGNFFPNTGQGAVFSTNAYNNAADVGGGQFGEIYTYMEVPSGSFTAGASTYDDVIPASELLALDGAALNTTDGLLSFIIGGVTKLVSYEITTMSVTDVTSGPAQSMYCWDINGNGVADPVFEDFDDDGVVNVYDCRGAEGPAGPQGPAGADGATGSPGVAGADGATGSPGPAGAAGAQGPQGIPGVQGDAGSQGPAGIAGAIGPQGIAGADGAAGLACWDLNGNGLADAPEEDINNDALFNSLDCAGPVGSQGLAGTDGAVGATGPQGPAGTEGADGAIGPQGPAGADGVAGAIGPQGPAGTDGANGAIGPQGPAGADGVAGAIGPQGPAGTDGVAGAIGPQGPAGTDGVAGATGPQGPAGADGVAGAIGPQGPAGADGADGVQGPQGIAGVPGDTGQQGPAGVDGADGATGAQGLAGADGATGPQGPAGTNGIDGAQGAPGMPGSQGIAGADGPIGPQGPAGAQGLAGGNGLACWDTNGNGAADSAEDVNGDGVYDAIDCQAAAGTYFENTPTRHVFEGWPGGRNSNARVMRIVEVCPDSGVAVSAGIQLNGDGRFDIRTISLFPVDVNSWKAVLYNDGPGGSSNQPVAKLRLICKSP